MLIFTHPLVAAARAWLWLTDPDGRAARWRERWAAEHGRPWPGNVPPVGAESTAARKEQAKRVRWEREHLVPWPGLVTPPPAACDVAAARRRREGNAAREGDPRATKAADDVTLDELLTMAKALDARILAARAKTLHGRLIDIAPSGVGMVAGGDIRAGATVAGIRLANGTLVLFTAHASEI